MIWRISRIVENNLPRNRYFAHILEQNQWKQAIQGYLASIHFADAMLGRLLDALKKDPTLTIQLWFFGQTMDGIL